MKRADFVCVALCLMGVRSLWALDSAKRISQYAHAAWRMQDGAFSGTPHSITQTTDGYIWIGTDAGLVKFDGVRFTPWQAPADRQAAISDVYSLLGGRDGTLWIGMARGLTSLKDGRLVDFFKTRGRINAILEDHVGTVWAARSRVGTDHAGGLCQVAGEQLRCTGNSGGMALDTASALAEDSAGNLWIGSSSELVRWRSGISNSFFQKELKEHGGLAGIDALAVGRDQSIWVGFDRKPLGLERLIEGVPPRVVLRGFNTSAVRAVSLLFDRRNSLWIGTVDDGIYRITGDQVDHFSRDDGLTGNSVESLYEDAEGNLWVVTTKGLDVFRDTRVTTISTVEGLSSDRAKSVLAARDGTVWIGNLESLDLLRGNKVSSIRMGAGLPGHQVTSLYEDHDGRIWVGIDHFLTIYEHGRFRTVPGVAAIITAICEDTDGNVWAVSSASPQPRLFRIVRDRPVEEVPQSEIPPVRIVVPDPRRGVWFGLANGGLARYQSGKFEILVKDIRARYLAVDKDGSVWAAGRNGLFRWREGTLKQLGTTNGLPCESIFAIIKDDADALWLYSACGLISISAAEIDRWWQEPDRKVLSRVFDALDGAQPSSSTFLPQVSKSPDGRLWFTNDTIIQTIDPRRLNDNRIVPPVHIEEVIADRKNYEARGALHLPAHTRDIEIDYTALSFRVPQKVRFRYKLDGRNPEWQDAGTRRQVFVSDLPPGWYKFHVIASNNDAVWNEAGASLDFYVAPAFYQTVWFRGASLAALLAFVAALYRARIRYLRDQFNLRLESRMNERTRIARDFHDTLLQSFQGVLLKFHAVVYMIPEQPDARMALENAMEDARNAIAEGRDAVQGLRSPLVVTEDFTRAITMLGEGLAATTGSDGPRFLVHVEGSPTDLAAGVRDEVYRVAGEGLRNAFRHASARRVEVDIHYDKRHFCVRVRDDGKGIDPQFLKGGREGHHGLKGMQERAKAVRGKLAIWSERDSGTEIELTIPAAFAYTKRLRRAPGGKGKLGEL